MSSTKRLSVWLRLAVLAAMSGASAAHAVDLDKTVSLDIDAQSLVGALNEFSRQAGVQVMSSAGAVDQRRAPRVAGQYSVGDALRLILSETELTYLSTGPNTIVVTAPAGSETQSRGALSAEESLRTSLRLAQSGTFSPPREGDLGEDGEGAGGNQKVEGPAQSAFELEEIIVTGTHIRGGAAIGANVLVLDRTDIEDSGYSTVQDVLKTIPQNFGASKEEITPSGGGNFSRGTGANLRGLGTGATLTLLNGRRMAPAADGALVDVSSIPASAIERIEILTDGASAIYGSDAIGGVVNIILRRDFEGAQTQGRYASADGGAEETSAAQLLGTSWGGGNAMLSYQFYRRSALQIADRSYSASADKTAFGGADYRNMFSNPGNILDPLTFRPAYAIPRGQDGTALTVSDLLPGVQNLQSTFDGSDLLGRNESHSAFFTFTHSLTDDLELSADARYSKRSFEYRTTAAPQILVVPSTNPFYVNPFGGTGPVRIAYSFIDDFGNLVTSGDTETWAGTIEGKLNLGPAWALRVSVNHSAEEFFAETPNIVDLSALALALADSNPATAFNPFGDGSNTNPATLAGLLLPDRHEGEASVQSASAIADGPLFFIGEQAVTLAIGADYREEQISSTQSREELGREIFAGFAELALPLMTSSQAGGRPLLEASIAGRFEQYSDFGSTLNPKLGLRFAPLESLALRGTWGTSFKAPRLFDLSHDTVVGAPHGYLTSVFDPRVGRSAVVLVREGNNPDLDEETATSWTAGFDVVSKRLHGLKVSGTYYDIDYTDRILRPAALLTQVLIEENVWSEIITRDPTPEQLAELCSSIISGNCSTTPPVAIIDRRLRNAAALRVHGVDLMLGMPFDTAVGAFNVQVNGNYVLDHEQKLSSTAPAVSLLNTAFNPIDLHLRAVTTWRWRNFSTTLAVNYADDYASTVNADGAVDAWTTVDVGLSYRGPSGANWLDGAEIAVRANNVLDEDPPFLNFPLGYDTTNANALGRFISVQLRKTW